MSKKYSRGDAERAFSEFYGRYRQQTESGANHTKKNKPMEAEKHIFQEGEAFKTSDQTCVGIIRVCSYEKGAPVYIVDMLTEDNRLIRETLQAEDMEVMDLNDQVKILMDPRFGSPLSQNTTSFQWEP